VRRAPAWLIPLPLIGASWLSAHCGAYLLFPPKKGEHDHLHAASEHASFGSTPVLLACGLALVAAGLCLCVRDGLHGRRPSGQPRLLFALLPAAGFAVQEHLERLIASGSVPVDLFAQPTFLVGIALQLPFAVAALLLARGLYALGYSLGRVLARGVGITRAARMAPCLLVRLPRAATIHVPSVLALGHGQRAPPLPVVP
jgi:hypothetical protein